MKNGNTLYGDLLVLFAMSLFGGYALFLRFFPDINPLLFLLAFQVVGLVFFWPMAWRQGFPALSSREKRLLAALAVVALANDLTYFVAFRLTTVANAAVAHQMVSVFLLFFAPLFLKEKTRRNEWIALGLAVIGTGVLYSDGIALGWSHTLGITLGLASAVFYALLIVLYRKLVKEESGRTVSVVNTWRFALSVLILLPILGWNGTLVEMNWSMFWPLAAFGFLFAFVASGIHNYGISRTRALHVSILGKSEPVFATAYAVFFLSELPTIPAIVGGILIIGSSFWLAMDTKGEV